MNRTTAFITLLAASTAIAIANADAGDIDFVRDVQPILQSHCYSCHGPATQKSGLRLDIKSEAFRGGEGWGPSIVPDDSSDSPMIELVSSDDEYSRMPPEGEPLSDSEIRTLTDWVDQGATWPDGVDLAQVEDRTDHWSLKPIAVPDVPAIDDDEWTRSDLDRFILSRLEQHGLTPSSPARPLTWLRRVTLDLTGLPPTPEEVDEFLKRESDGESAYAAVVDRLLASPRYGERWAQHWLDVVRYADTHGFEVNTDRPHAWPYRDYVIEALNQDTPYDRFIKEQIVGDAMGQDAATGFLVTASVLLPGQIGKDAPSKRLARQDAIDEIVNNIGQTFLGLSVGCARCHDHKFDAISAKDYYAMQAFVAGVEYADREIRSPQTDALKKSAEGLHEQLATIEQQLAGFVPIATPRKPTSPSAGVSQDTLPTLVDAEPQRSSVRASLNIDRFAPVQAKRLRFTILSTNKLEPCIDELEVFNTQGENVALAGAAATVTTSGDRVVANRHEPRFVNDGQYGNSHSWMSSIVGGGWVDLEFASEQEIVRVQWGRDRNEQYDDRLATSYQIEVSSDSDANGSTTWQLVADSTDRKKWSADGDRSPAFTLVGLNPTASRAATGLLDQKGALEKKIKIAETERLAFAGKFRKPDDIHLLRRGDPEQPAERVTPAVLSALGDLTLPAETAEQDRRRILADWIADPHHPLTARVMVNRLWQWHFGIGLVETANDFGRNGTPPSHPKLLDWLAMQFIDSGWSMKSMHRMIVLSSTYRQGAVSRPDAAALDADVRLLWRYPSRRLEAEAIRDSMLAVTGQLNLKMGGRGFLLFKQRGGLSGFTPIESFTGEGLRRMIYAHKVRREPDAIFGAFDCPDGGQSAARRSESTTPIQALNLFNSRFTIEQAENFAESLKQHVGDDAAEQIREAYWRGLNRFPEPDELDDALPVVREHGLKTFCRALFNSNEFLFLP